jgi:hypothetical protein
MFRIIGIVVVCLLLLFGLGVYFQWFTFSTSNTNGNRPDIHVGVNKDKIEEDLKPVKGLFGSKTVEGTIQKIEPVKKELTILDKQKKDVTIKVDEASKIKIGDKDGSAFSDLKVGDPVSVKYDTKKDGNDAKTITVTKSAD